MLLWPSHSHECEIFKAVSPLPIPAKGTGRISWKTPVTIFILERAAACQMAVPALLSADVVKETFCVAGPDFVRIAIRLRRHHPAQGQCRRLRHDPHREVRCCRC